jgi:cysteine synthase A
MTEERKKFITGLGAELLLCSAGDFAQAARIRDTLAQSEAYFNPDQFSNPLNVECHRETTGKEILQQLYSARISPDALVAGVGTGGTLMGVAMALKSVNPDLWVAAVEPEESPVMSGGQPGLHGIGGIGDGFIPAIVQGDRRDLHEVINEVIQVSTSRAVRAANAIRRVHGFCVGTSSGASFLAAQHLSSRYKHVVTIFADGYFKYQSQGLEYCGKGRCPYESARHNVLPYAPGSADYITHF